MKILLSAILLFMSIQSSASQVFDQEVFLGPEIKFETYSGNQSKEIFATLSKIDMNLCPSLAIDLRNLKSSGYELETVKYAAPTDDRYPMHILEYKAVSAQGDKKEKSFNCPRSW